MDINILTIQEIEYHDLLEPCFPEHITRGLRFVGEGTVGGTKTLVPLVVTKVKSGPEGVTIAATRLGVTIAATRLGVPGGNPLLGEATTTLDEDQALVEAHGSMALGQGWAWAGPTPTRKTS